MEIFSRDSVKTADFYLQVVRKKKITDFCNYSFRLVLHFSDKDYYAQKTFSVSKVHILFYLASNVDIESISPSISEFE